MSSHRPPPPALGRAWLRPVTFDPRHNSMNLVRLLLAWAVLVSHSYPIAGWGEGPGYAGENLGGWAVIGFFALSGYLIMGSRLRSDAATYLMLRVARIFPAFLVCLIVTALAFAPIGYWSLHGTLDGFLTTANTPLNYIYANSGLRMVDYSIAGTPDQVPYPGTWNGSLWSLYFEFVCYLVVGVLAFIPLVRRSVWPIAIAFGISVLAQMQAETVSALVGGNGEVLLLVKMLPYFLAGSLIYVLGDRVKYNAPIAAGAVVVAVLVITAFPQWGGQLTAPLLGYALLWLSMVLPAPRFILTHDVSYGAYIYAFPIQQLVVIAGGAAWGVIGYVAAATLATAALATASWFAIERPVLTRARRHAARMRAGQAALVAAEPAQAGSTPG